MLNFTVLVIRLLDLTGELKITKNNDMIRYGDWKSTV